MNMRDQDHKPMPVEDALITREREEQAELNALYSGILAIKNAHPDPLQRPMFRTDFWNKRGTFFITGVRFRRPAMNHPPTTLARIQSAQLAALSAVARSTATPEANILNLRMFPRWVINARLEVWGEIKQASNSVWDDKKHRDPKWVLAYRKHLLRLLDHECQVEPRWPHSRQTEVELYTSMSLSSHRELQKRGWVEPQLWDHLASCPIRWADIAHPNTDTNTAGDRGHMGDQGPSQGGVTWDLNELRSALALKKP